jgi:DNA processing protein
MWKIKSCNKADSCYPTHLKNQDSAPKILYYVGDISACESIVVAVVGKRDAKERYLQIAHRIGEMLAKEGCTVLNGLAIGCDAQALEGAVAANGKVVAVMAGGLDEVYPRSNQRLAEKIVENGGCLISEYPSGMRPQKYMFVQRDRIQAMLSNKVFIVDAEKEGGTMHTAEYAVKYDKPLGCFVEVAGRESPSGNQYLVDLGKASAIRDTEGLLAFVGQPEYTQMSLF